MCAFCCLCRAVAILTVYKCLLGRRIFDRICSSRLNVKVLLESGGKNGFGSL